MGFLVFMQICMALALFLIISFAYFSFYKASKSNVSKHGKIVLDDVSGKLVAYFVQSGEILDSAADSLNFMLRNGEPQGKIKNYLREITIANKEKFSKEFEGVYGYINGEFVDGSDWKPNEDFIPTMRDWYVDAQKNGGKLTFVRPYVDVKTSTVIFSVSELLVDRESVVSIDIPMLEIQHLISDTKVGQGSTSFIIDSSSFVASHTDTSQIGDYYFENMVRPENRAIAKKVIGKDECDFDLNYDGVPSNVFAKRIFGDWYFVMVIPTKSLMIDIQRDLQLTLVGFLVVVCFILYQFYSNFKHRNKVARYAHKLEVYKTKLEKQYVDQRNMRVRAEAENARNLKKLSEMQECVIEGMATIIEYRDMNTGHHVQNTKHYVLMLANYLYEHGLHKEEVDEEFLSMVGNAAAMHDIGKIAIPDQILNKPAKLTEDEFAAMQQHTVMGAGIVRAVFGESIDRRMLEMCVQVVMYHHEKWNGKGYPVGLEGSDIPLCARIMAIADVFDACASRRVYKEAFDVDDVFEIIRKDAGSHFDPELAEIFIALKDDVKAYLKKKYDKKSNVGFEDSMDDDSLKILEEI